MEEFIILGIDALIVGVVGLVYHSASLKLRHVQVNLWISKIYLYEFQIKKKYLVPSKKNVTFNFN